MNTFTRFSAVCAVVLLVSTGFFVPQAHATALSISNLCFSEFYNSQKLIYAQDIKPTTPTQDSDSAIINDRDGNTILIVKQKNDVKVVWPETKLVVVYAGEALRYEGTNNHYLKVDILNTNQSLVSSVIYDKSSNPKVNINQDGYIRFNQGETAIQLNYLLLCGDKSSFPGGGNTGGNNNQSPIWSQIPTQSVSVGQLLQFSVFASDPNGDFLTYSAFNLPAGATFNSFSKTFSWVPGSNQAGNYTVTFRVSDGFSSVDMNVPITVFGNGNGGGGNGSNQPPVWNQINGINVGANQYVQFTVFATDPNGDSLSYDAFNLPSGATFNSFSHVFSWIASYNQGGTYTVTFRVSDGFSSVDMNVPITVSSNYNNQPYYPYNPPYYNQNPYNPYGNQPPVWSQVGTQTLYVGQNFQLTVYASDPNGDYLTYGTQDLPAGSTFNTFTHVFSWTPGSNQTGTYNVIFRVNDSTNTVTMAVPFTILGSRQQPTYQTLQFVNFNPPLVAAEGQFYSYTVYAVGGSGSVSYSLLSSPAGMIINPSTGLISWTPGYTQAAGAPYTVTVQASNGSGVVTKGYLLAVENVSLGGTTVTPPPPPRTITPPPTEAKLAASEIKIETQSNGDVLVLWTTNKPSTARVIYDTASQAEKTSNFTYANATQETTETATEQKVNLGNLELNKTYYLRVVSKIPTEIDISNELTFVKLPPAGLGSAFGTLAGIPVTTWIFIIVSGTLATFLYLGYRRSQMTASA